MFSDVMPSNRRALVTVATGIVVVAVGFAIGVEPVRLTRRRAAVCECLDEGNPWRAATEYERYVELRGSEDPPLLAEIAHAQLCDWVADEFFTYHGWEHFDPRRVAAELATPELIEALREASVPEDPDDMHVPLSALGWRASLGDEVAVGELRTLLSGAVDDEARGPIYEALARRGHVPEALAWARGVADRVAQRCDGDGQEDGEEFSFRTPDEPAIPILVAHGGAQDVDRLIRIYRTTPASTGYHEHYEIPEALERLALDLGAREQALGVLRYELFQASGFVRTSLSAPVARAGGLSEAEYHRVREAIGPPDSRWDSYDKRLALDLHVEIGRDRLGSAGALERIEAMLDSPEGQVRLEAAIYLVTERSEPRSECVLPLVREELTLEDPSDAWSELIGIIGDSSDLPLLRAHLGVNGERCVEAALRILRRSGVSLAR